MDFEKARFNMVEQQIRPWEVLDFNVLDALSEIPRERFVQTHQQGYAYSDMPLPLANGGVMIEPKIIARMAQALALKKSDRVMEIGTGSGYATAVLAQLAGSVNTFDLDPQQQALARTVLDALGYTEIVYESTDGLKETESPTLFDAIYVGGAVPSIPEVLKKRLAEGGRMVVVAGDAPVQHCYLIRRCGDVFQQSILFDTLIGGLNDKSFGQTSKFRF